MRFRDHLFLFTGCLAAALLASPSEASAQNNQNDPGTTRFPPPVRRAQPDVGRDILSPIFNGIGGALNSGNNSNGNVPRQPPNQGGNSLFGRQGNNSFNDFDDEDYEPSYRPSYRPSYQPNYQPSYQPEYVRPAPTLPLPPSEPIVLQNPSHTNTVVYYKLNGSYSYTMQAGHSQTLGGDRRWTIDFQRGGTYGSKQYALEPGKTYRFKGTAQGWELVASTSSSSEVAGTPAIPLPPIE